MGHSGFTLLESGSAGYTANDDLITPFTLPDDWPEAIFTFLQIDFSLDTLGIISIVRDGTSYPINNGNQLIGEVYRSIPIQKGEVINIKIDANQTLLKFKFGLEE